MNTPIQDHPLLNVFFLIESWFESWKARLRSLTGTLRMSYQLPCACLRKLVSFIVEEFYSGTTYDVLALEKSFNMSAMMWNVSLLSMEDTRIHQASNLSLAKTRESPRNTSNQPKRVGYKSSKKDLNSKK